MGMKSLVIGISCWMWFRKKICSRYGRCCLFLILFLPSLLIAKPQDKVILTRHQTSPQKQAWAHRLVILHLVSGSSWILWNWFIDIYGCVLYPRNPSPDGIILSGKRKWKYQMNKEKTWHRYPDCPYSWIFCALYEDAHPGMGRGLECSLYISGQVVHPGVGLCLWREGSLSIICSVCIDLIKNPSLTYSTCLRQWGRLTSIGPLLVDQKLQEDQMENVSPIYFK